MSDSSEQRTGKAPGHHDQQVGALWYLPAVHFALAPELDAVSTIEESRADCSRCDIAPPSAGQFEDGPWALHPEVRGCMFQPDIGIFLVFGGLVASESATQLLRSWLRLKLDATTWGINPSDGWREHYQRVAPSDFGRDTSLRCPYWVAGIACRIWPAWPTTCRTWFYNNYDVHDPVLWTQWRIVLSRLGGLLAELCIETGHPPKPNKEASESATELWLEWYRQCARMVEPFDPDEFTHRADNIMVEARASLRQLSEWSPHMLPNVVVPAVRETIHGAHGTRISDHSIYDTVTAPNLLFRVLAELDCTRTWRDARAQTMTSYGSSTNNTRAIDAEGLEVATIVELHRVGALESPDRPDARFIERLPWPGSSRSPGQSKCTHSDV